MTTIATIAIIAFALIIIAGLALATRSVVELVKEEIFRRRWTQRPVIVDHID